MFELPFRAIEIRDQVESFFNDRILPNHKLWLEQAAAGEAVPSNPAHPPTGSQSPGPLEYGASQA